jgi:hypothetical protein
VLVGFAVVGVVVAELPLFLPLPLSPPPPPLSSLPLPLRLTVVAVVPFGTPSLPPGVSSSRPGTDTPTPGVDPPLPLPPDPRPLHDSAPDDAVDELGTPSSVHTAVGTVVTGGTTDEPSVDDGCCPATALDDGVSSPAARSADSIDESVEEMVVEGRVVEERVVEGGVVAG